MRVEDLDDQLSSADGRVERTWRRQQRGCGRVQLGDLDRTLPQGVIEGVMEVSCHEHADRRADDDESDQDPECGRDDRAKLKRAPSHRPSTKPTPRTVSISGGSPSLRRRYET